MRLPVKSESDAFYLTFAVVLVFFVAVLLGALVDPVVGVAALGVVALTALVWQLRRKDPDRATLRDARAETAADGRRRLLVIANQTVAGEELRAEIAQRARADELVRVVAPVLPSRAHYYASDIDRELGEAQARLDATLRWLRDHGVEASGRVGDMTPRQAIEDELRTFPADELLISTHPAKRSHWLESGLVETCNSELDIPVAHVVVDLEREAARA
jgi:hypothetical protein